MSQNEENRTDEVDGADGTSAAGDGDRHASDSSKRADSPDAHSVESGDAESQESNPDSNEEFEQSNDVDEVARMREAMLRLKAEMDNREKRLEREMTKSRKFAVERLVRDLIPVLDSMDQALTAEPSSEGMELTREQALKVLSEHGLEALEPLGERFDPTWHEAIATQPSDSDPDDTVLQVLQKGYRLNERLVRPARVIVAKAS